MQIRTLQGTIQTELFQEIMLHEQLGIITFSYGYVLEEDRGEGPTYTVQLPMTFPNRETCKEMFRRYLRGRNEGRDTICMYANQNWPWEVYEKIVKHKASKLERL